MNSLWTHFFIYVIGSRGWEIAVRFEVLIFSVSFFVTYVQSKQLFLADGKGEWIPLLQRGYHAPPLGSEIRMALPALRGV